MSFNTATHEEHGHHIVSVKTYGLVIAALFVLMAATVGAAFIDLGSFNPVLALLIAVSKAVLIVLIFMNVYFSTRLTQIFVAGGFFWLTFLFGMIIIDFLSRGIVTTPQPWN